MSHGSSDRTNPRDSAHRRASARHAELRSGFVQGAAIAAVIVALAAPLLWWRHTSLETGDAARAAAGVGSTIGPTSDRIGAASRSATAAPMATPRAALDPELAATLADDVRAVAAWALASGDTGAAPFVVVDKRRTHVHVFDAAGHLLGASPVLLGHARGDDTVPGIGERAIEDVKPSERTTPAGRFIAAPGRNLLGDDVIWVDYDAAVSMHRVRTTAAGERRQQRLDTPTTEDNRISYGCINVPVTFFDQTVWPALAHRRAAVVYVLPEVKPLEAVFPGAVAWRDGDLHARR